MISHSVTHLPLLTAAVPLFETAGVTELFWLRWPFLFVAHIPLLEECSFGTGRFNSKKPCILERSLLNLPLTLILFFV
jgi:hypothetical protein